MFYNCIKFYVLELDEAKNIDFYEFILDEGEEFYTTMYRFKKECINLWFKENVKYFGEINSYTDLNLDRNFINSVAENDYTHQELQCHYSAKRITQLYPEVKYITGFVVRNDFPHSLVTRSFNLFDDKIIDLARLDERFGTLEDDDTFPHYYFGFEIPSAFVKQYENETIENYSMSPLLFEWFEENNFCEENEFED